MHLVIVSTPRAGAHMLRSMLRADPLVRDIGAFIFPDDGQVVEPPPEATVEAVRAVYERELGVGAPGVLLSHLKLMHGHFDAIRAAAQTGGRFLLLTRRDRLAQACSLLLAARYAAFTSPAPEGAQIKPTPKQVRDLIDRFDKLERLARLHLEDLPFAELAYEDISIASVVAALTAIGIELNVGDPTTTKSAPRLADYVTNLSELI